MDELGMEVMEVAEVAALVLVTIIQVILWQVDQEGLAAVAVVVG